MNDDETPGLCFRYDDMPAGYFEQGVVPVRAGRYAYMPFRNLGHLEMVRAARAGARPRCRLRHVGCRISFEVLAIPEAHVMVIDAVDRVAEPP